MRITGVWWGLCLCLGCGGTRTGEAQRDVAENRLVTTIEAEVRRDTVGFVLHVTNAGDQPLMLEFSTAARYDFEVRTPEGELVWRWSDDQMAAQVMGSETIAAGATQRYRQSWTPGGRTGRFAVVGRLLATNVPVEQRADFEIPKP